MARTVLIVDDDDDIRQALSDVLEEEGYHAVLFSGGLLAVEWMRDHPRQPCLILLDMLMPGFSGWDFLNKMRAENLLDGAKVVITSASSLTEKDVVGVDVILRKPFKIEALLDIICQHCERDSCACDDGQAQGSGS